MSTTSTSSGWNRSTSTPKPAPKKPNAMRGVVAGLVVVALAVVCAVVFMGKGEKPVENTKKRSVKIKEAGVPPQGASKKERAQREESVATAEAVSTGFPYKVWLGKKVVGYSCATNSKTNVITERLVTEDGKTHSIDTWPKGPDISSTDQLILLSIGTDPSKPMPPSPMSAKIDDKKALEDLKKEIKILPTDNYRDRKMKERLIALRDEIRERMEQGESFRDIVSSHQASVREGIEMSREAQKDVSEIAKTDRDAAFEAAEKYNEKLRQFGISKEVSVPLSDDEKRQVREAMQRERAESEKQSQQEK